MPRILNILDTYFSVAHICYSFLNFIQFHYPLNFWFWHNDFTNSERLGLPFWEYLSMVPVPHRGSSALISAVPQARTRGPVGWGRAGIGRGAQSQPGWAFPKKPCISWYQGIYLLRTSSREWLEGTQSPAIGTFQGFPSRTGTRDWWRLSHQAEILAGHCL